MRNIIEFPITADEAIEVLNRAEENERMFNAGDVGGIDGITLLLIEKFIEQNKERFNTFSRASLEVIFENKNA